MDLEVDILSEIINQKRFNNSSNSSVNKKMPRIIFKEKNII